MHEVQTTKEEWAALFLLRMFIRKREGVYPKGNLNNVILFLYINKCSEKSQTLVHCKKLVQFFFFIKVFSAQGIR